jgi:hypothetical protein
VEGVQGGLELQLLELFPLLLYLSSKPSFAIC